MKTLIVLVGLAGVAGCATPGWIKPNGTQQEFAQDRFDCMKQSQVIGSTETNGNVFSACMGAHGWRWQ